MSRDILKKIRSMLRINAVIESLILSDFLLFFGLGLSAPIFAVFVMSEIQGAKIEVVGLATMIYWLVRFFTSAPLSRYMDKTDGERDEFFFMFSGSLLSAVIPLLYLISSEAWHIYVLQGLFGIAHTMAIPGWRILFTNHLDAGKIGYEWSLEDMVIAFGTATSAYAGSLIASHYGFATLFLCMSTIMFAGSLLLLPIRHEIKSRYEVLELRRAHRRKRIPVDVSTK